MIRQLTIDPEALKANYRFLCDKAAPARLAAVVKANAYGLGAGPVAVLLYAAGCRTFITADFNEAVSLRRDVPDPFVPIIVLHGIARSCVKEAMAKNIVPVINHLGALESCRSFAREMGHAVQAFIHLDTGMNRLGLDVREQNLLATNQDWLEGVNVSGWMSHFVSSENFEGDETPRQRARLIDILKKLPNAPVSLCNSSGIFWGSDYLFDMVRPGIALYGGNPTPHLPNPMRNVVSIRAPILQLHEAAAGETVGYNGIFTCKRETRIATIGYGYADGYLRSLENKGAAMIGSYLAPVIGRISMDLITLDVTDIPADDIHRGDDAILMGPHRPLDEVAREAGTIPYEILTNVGPRVQRLYI